MIFHRGVIKRAAISALIVGPIYITINHWDAILAGDIDGRRAIKMAMTMVVPYLVSTFSSVATMRSMQKKMDTQHASAQEH